MTLDHVQIRSYFAPPERSYWRWQDEGQVIAWQDGLTICFRKELERLLAALAPQGLPPLGSVLLLLAACRDSWEEPPDRRTVLHTHLGLLYGGGYYDLLSEVLTGLGQVHSLRQKFRGGALTGLAVTMFDEAPGCYSPDRSANLVERFGQGLVEDEIEWKAQSPLDDLLHDLGCLRWGLKRFDPNAAALRARTGLEDLPQAAEVEPPPPTSARELIAALQDDPDLGAVARLAHLLLAAVHLPRALSDPDELPIGGVSDIVNRGPLDRLLLSELAHDDLTLAVRVAMNEALYLRRESPPRSPPRRRRVLLDAGLRSWGVPRVFIAAVGLAISAKSDPKLRVKVFRAEGSQPVPVDLDSVGGLEAHLAALDHHLHPAAALCQLAQEDPDEQEESDLVLVTTDDVPADYEFQRQLHESGPPSLFVATVSRGGQFQLTLRSRRGSKVLCQAKFDLDEVFRPRPKRARLLDPRRQLELPAIFRQQVFPLRLATPVSVARSWLVHPGSVITFARDGRLLLWDSPERGARQIAENLPDGGLHWCSSAWEDDTVRLVIGKQSQRGLKGVTYNRRTQQLQIVALQLAGTQPRSVVGQAGHVFVFYADAFDVVSLTTGELLGSRPIPTGMTPPSLYFPHILEEGGREWRAMACVLGVSQMIVAQELVFRETPQVEVRAMVRCIGREGPVGITYEGAVFDPATGKVCPPQPSELARAVASGAYAFGGFSRDGQRVLFRIRPALPTIHPHLRDGQQGVMVLDLLRNEIGSSSTYHHDLLERPIFDIARARVVRSRFTSIGVSRHKRLVLISHRGQRWPIFHDEVHKSIRFAAEPQPADGQDGSFTRIPFEPVEGFERGYSLAVATWPDGSRAWLDGRGLLHLRSSDGVIPECSLILTDGPMAGWLDDGRVFGPEYWHDEDEPNTPVLTAFNSVLLPFASRVG
jgi:hypothetical protein